MHEYDEYDGRDDGRRHDGGSAVASTWWYALSYCPCCSWCCIAPVGTFPPDEYHAATTASAAKGTVRSVSHCSKNNEGAYAFSAFKSVVQTLAKQGAESVVEGLYHLFHSPAGQLVPPRLNQGYHR